MTATTWIIIALLLVSFYQYNNPDKANEILKPIWGPVKDIVDNKNPLGNNNTSGICPDTNNPVCGDNGKNYINTCEAALDGVLKVTPGAC